MSTCAEMFGLKSPLPSATSASPGRKSTSIICMRWPSAIIVPPRSSVFRGPRITSAITPPPSLMVAVGTYVGDEGMRGGGEGARTARRRR